MKRYLYYCNSAYQLLTVLNLHWHRKQAGFERLGEYEADLIILNVFKGAADMAAILEKEKTFGKIFLKDRAYNGGRLHTLYTVLDVLSPSFFLKTKHAISRKEVKSHYDVICVPKYSTIMSAIWRLNRKARLDLYEDGLGAYYLNTDLLYPHSRLYKLLYRTPFVRDFTHFSRLYLNDSELFTGDWDKEIVDVPSFDEGYLSHLRTIFAGFADVEDESRKDIYWLSQLLENDQTKKTVEEVLAVLTRDKERVVYCPHPRFPVTDKIIYDLAPAKQIWEMKLLNMTKLEEDLLISIHSTACLTPKLLFDKEPYLILFYELIDKEVTEINDKFILTMERFIARYRDPKRIMIPKTIEEFRECVDRFTTWKDQEDK